MKMRSITRILSLVAILALLVVVGTVEPVTAQSEWSVPMAAATTTEGNNPNLEFGANVNATDGFDSGIDIPHPQPPTTFNAYFSIDDVLFPQLDKDYRAPAETTIRWTLHLESNAEEIALTWDASAVPEDIPLWMTGTGVQEDMKAGNSTVLPAGTHELTIATELPAPCGTIALDQGWNLISLPLIPDNSGLETMLAPVWGDFVRAFKYDRCTETWTSYIKDGPTPSLTDLEDGYGYWILMDASGTFTVDGVVALPPPNLPPSYDVCEGWNLIGFKSCDPMTVNDYLAGIAGDYTVVYASVEGSLVRIEGSDQMEPGCGYWVAVTEAGTIYP